MKRKTTNDKQHLVQVLHFRKRKNRHGNRWRGRQYRRLRFQKLVSELVVYPDGGQHLDVRKTPCKRYAEKYRIHAQRAYADFRGDGF